MDIKISVLSVIFLSAVSSDNIHKKKIERQTYEYFAHPVTDGTWFIDVNTGKYCFKQGSTIFVPRDDDEYYSAWVPSSNGTGFVLNDQYKWTKDQQGIWYPKVDVYAACGNNLVASVVVFRHGERTPRNFYPNDPYKNNSYWPAPFGELTNNGIRQAHDLGKWVRQRYEKFLPKRYSSKDFFIYSSGIDRTLMSASAFASGLYPVTSRNAINYQPVPVHSKPPDIDNTIFVSDEICPKKELLLDNLLKTNFFRKIDEENAQLFAYMSSYMGLPITTFLGLEDFYDTFFIEELNNFTLPEWAKAIYPCKLQKLAYLNHLLPTYTTELAKFKIGSMYSEILSYFESFSDKPREFQSDFNMKENGRKLLAISGHDTTIVALLNTLKVPNINWPPYSCAVIFELTKDDDSEFYVSAYFKNRTELMRLKIDSCGVTCKLKSFIDYLRPITMNPKLFIENCQTEFKLTQKQETKFPLVA